MSGANRDLFVFLPCSHGRCWVVPQNCVGEIVTVLASGDMPPESIQWRGQSVPVVDYGRQEGDSWKDAGAGTGLIAVMLGLEGSECPWWGVVLRNSRALTVACLEEDDIEDVKESDDGLKCTVFRYRGELYEVPDLETMQRHLLRDGLAVEGLTA